MRAHEIVERPPVVGPDDDAGDVALMVATRGLPGVVVAGADGLPQGVLSLADVLRCVLPRAVSMDHCLARTFAEAQADGIAAEVARQRLRDVLLDPPAAPPVVDASATLLEVASAMAGAGSPLALVRDGDRLLGVVRADVLLARLLGQSRDARSSARTDREASTS